MGCVAAVLLKGIPPMGAVQVASLVYKAEITRLGRDKRQGKNDACAGLAVAERKSWVSGAEADAASHFATLPVRA